MKLRVPPGVRMIIEKLNAYGFEAYAVGGCVRDSILGRVPDDWDITTSAKPEEVKGLFGRTVDTGLVHGTVTVLVGGTGYEVTTYRIDGEYEDARHPSSVEFTGSLEEDLKRRDFTINAMAYSEKDGLIDLFGGMEDLQRHVIRCVGDPRLRFGEDALRILRAVRFAAQLGFAVEEETKGAIRELAGTLKVISAERIQVEIVKMLVSQRPQMWEMVWEMGITKVIMPEFDLMMETEQNTPHHMYNVGVHTLKVMEHVRGDKVLRLAALLHDVGKPKMRTTDENGRDHFKRHAEAGQEIAGMIMKRLKFDNDTTNKVLKLVYWHDLRPKVEAAAIRRAMYHVGVDLFPLLLELQVADTMGKSMHHRQEKLQLTDYMKQVYEEIMAKEQCVSLKDLALTGSDLIEMGMKPGPRIGEVLNAALSEVLERPEHNSKEYLMQFAKSLI